MGRKRKFEALEARLGDKLPLLICGLLNKYGIEKTAKLLGMTVLTLRIELARLGIAKRWVRLNPTVWELIEEEEEAVEEMTD